MSKVLTEENLYLIFQEALRTEGMDVLKLAQLAGKLPLSCIESKARELAQDGRPVTDEEWGKAFWELLKEAIDRLKPSGPPPKSLTPEWHPHVILYEEYVLGTRNRDIANSLYLSWREMLRRRREAIRRVVRQLIQWG